MNRFGEIADELTDLIEELDSPELAAEAKRLKVALERAFARACEAERSLRQKTEASPARGQPIRRGPVVRRAATGLAMSGPGLSGQVIELPASWRGAALARTRRLND